MAQAFKEGPEMSHGEKNSKPKDCLKARDVQSATLRLLRATQGDHHAQGVHGGVLATTPQGTRELPISGLCWAVQASGHPELAGVAINWMCNADLCARTCTNYAHQIVRAGTKFNPRIGMGQQRDVVHPTDAVEAQCTRSRHS